MSNKKPTKFEKRDCMTHSLEAWTDNLEEFLLTIADGEWIVTTGNRLFLANDVEGLLEKGEDEKESFWVGDASCTTYRLRQFCAEFHPEVDFDSEFETHKPGVFARYQDKFGHDYEEWTRTRIYRELKKTLADRGYRLHFKETEC